MISRARGNSDKKTTFSGETVRTSANDKVDHNIYGW